MSTDDLPRALVALDRTLLHQNLLDDRAPSLADEVRDLNDRVHAFALANLDFYDDPSSFQAVLRQTAWTAQSRNYR